VTIRLTARTAPLLDVRQRRPRNCHSHVVMSSLLETGGIVVEELRIPDLDLINQVEQGGVNADALVIRSPQHHSNRHSRWAFSPRARPADLARPSTIRDARLSESLGQAGRLLRRRARVFRVNHSGALGGDGIERKPLRSARYEGTSNRGRRFSLDKRSRWAAEEKMNRDMIAIEGSAGSLSTVLSIASRLPADFSGNAFVVVHIGHSRSRLPDLIIRTGKLSATALAIANRSNRAVSMWRPPIGICWSSRGWSAFRVDRANMSPGRQSIHCFARRRALMVRG
jgi:hypothetical protein